MGIGVGFEWGLGSDLGGDWGRILEGDRVGLGKGLGPDLGGDWGSELGRRWGRIWEWIGVGFGKGLGRPNLDRRMFEITKNLKSYGNV